MSWLDKIHTDLVITTGDGKEFRPDWVNAVEELPFNVAMFEFKELAGTLVYRGQPLGSRYGWEMLFQGEDHLDLRDEFKESSKNPAAWKVWHPYFGGILVQPARLTFDNSIENTTRITGEIYETITTDATKVVISAPDKIADDKTLADQALLDSYKKDVIVNASDRVSMLDKVDGIYTSVSSQISNNTDFSDFTNAYNSANALINTTVFDTLKVLQQIQTVVNYPASFADTLARRVNMFKLQLDFLNDAVTGITGVHDKKLYEFNAGTAVGGMILASVTNIGTSYDNRSAVLSVISTIVSSFDTYMTKLDGLQTSNGGSTTSYIPNPVALNALSQLVSYTVNALLAIANDSKQARTLILEEDSDPVSLTHRFYGMDADDKNLDYFIETNNIKLSKILEVKKGTEIIYYV